MQLCDRLKIPRNSPPKLRHLHGVWGVKHARNMGEMKAISQNMMHANIGITDGIYGRLPEDDMNDILSGMGGE